MSALPLAPLKGGELVDRMKEADSELGSMVRHDYSPDHPEYLKALNQGNQYSAALAARYPR